MTECPSQDELDAFASGEASPSERIRLQNHIDGCANCQRTNVFNMGATTPKLERRIIANATLAQHVPYVHAHDEFSFLMPPQNDDEIGRLQGYRVRRLLGQGGMGYVFLAEDLALGRLVALKIMKPANVTDPENSQRFLREARALAALKHDNLVTIYQAGHERDIAYFAMELLEGETLESWIRRKPPNNIREILRFARQIASGLAFLHSKNLIHRDLKPVNIWLEGPKRRVKILDLGLVRSTSGDQSLTADGIVMGTPEFMSPEQARGEQLDARSDLFSFGSLLYYLCTGRKPFQGTSAIAVIIALARDAPEPIRNVNPLIPARLGELIMQLLQRDPDDRVKSATDVLRRLNGIAEDLDATQAIAAPPATPTTKRTPKPKPDTQVLPANPGSGVIDIRKPPSKRRPDRARLWLIVAGCMIFLPLAAGSFFWGYRFFRPAIARNHNQEKEKENERVKAPEKAIEVVLLAHLKDTERENWPFQGKKGKDKKGFKDGPPPPPLGDEVVRFQNKEYPNGIFMHPPPPHLGAAASLTYPLNKQFSTFETDVSLRDGPARSETPVVFHVFGDGKQLWQSKPVTTQEHTQKCKIPVKGVNHLKIAVSCDGPPFGAHAIWIDPRLTK